MKEKKRPKIEQEPMGIVISRGGRGEQRPVFSAFVWGPPELAPVVAEKTA